MLLGLALASFVSQALVIVLLWLWVMGCIYNIPPIRAKDLPYIDVLVESINNPIRLLIGWYIVSPPFQMPASLMISYWMIGAYLMAIKRFAEMRDISRSISARQYRKSFAYYTEQNLLVSIMFYASASMLFFGAFVMRYRLELILSFPLIAFIMALYLNLAFKEDGGAQAPEKLWRDTTIDASVISLPFINCISDDCIVARLFCLFSTISSLLVCCFKFLGC